MEAYLKIINYEKNFVIYFSLKHFFVGCKKEGVYNPKEKIKRVYYERGLDASTKRLVEEWTWEKNNLVKIDYYDDNYGIIKIDYTEILSYDDKNRLTRIQDFVFNERYEITYDKKLISKIELYIDNELYQIMNFKYDRNKIVEVSVIEIDNSKILVSKSNKPQSYISKILPYEIPENTMRTKAASLSYIYTFEYDGDNLSKVKYIDDDNRVREYNYENYDKYKNPFYSSRFISNNIESGFSKNNVGKITTTTIGNTVRTAEFEYVYDGKFPIEIIERTTYSGSDLIWIYKTYYEYQ